MNIKLKPTTKPRAVDWESIEVGQGAQSVANTQNVLLKTGQQTGIRLTPYDDNGVGSTQHPGGASMWYPCEVEITCQPAVEVK